MKHAEGCESANAAQFCGCRESDEALRGRIMDAYGMWGAFGTAVIESSGDALDECARHVKLERR